MLPKRVKKTAVERTNGTPSEQRFYIGPMEKRKGDVLTTEFAPMNVADVQPAGMMPKLATQVL